MEGNKPRICFDMDGTLAEWRNIVFSAKIKKPEDVERAIEKLNEILMTSGYYISLFAHKNLCDSVKIIAESGEADVYVVSCAMKANKKCNPELEKREWVSKTLPFLPADHVIIVPNGEDKTKYIPGGVRPGDVLVDDYSKNLREWEAAGGCGVKFLNEVNEKKGTWKGRAISVDSSPAKIAEDLLKASKGRYVRHSSPAKNREPYIEITEDFELPGGLEI